MAVVQRRPGTKQGLVSRMFDGESVGRKEQRAEKAKPAETADVHTKPQKATHKAPVVHRKAGKVTAKKGRRK